jgi:hypothetical protein
MVRLLRLLSAAVLPEPIWLKDAAGVAAYHQATANRGFTPYFYTMVITAAFQTGSIPGRKKSATPRKAWQSSPTA